MPHRAGRVRFLGNVGEGQSADHRRRFHSTGRPGRSADGMMELRLTSVQLNLAEVGANADAAIADVVVPLTSAGRALRVALSPPPFRDLPSSWPPGSTTNDAGPGVRTTDLGTAWRGDMTATSK